MLEKNTVLLCCIVKREHLYLYKQFLGPGVARVTHRLARVTHRLGSSEG